MFAQKVFLPKVGVVVGNDGLPVNRVPTDQYAAQSFFKNDYGYLMSDIELLKTAQSQSIQDNLMQRLELFRVSNDNRTFTDIIDTIVPRYCQSYAERSAFMESLRQSHPEFFDKQVEEIEKLNSGDQPETDTNSNAE